MIRILKDPLAHFTLLGILLFVGFMQLNRDEAREQDIYLTQAQQRQIDAAFTRVWRRPPIEAEREALINDWIREEIANREAIQLGLIENDLVIRRRLRQKYESLMQQLDAAAEPAEQELREWYAGKATSYLRSPQYTLQQLFFSADQRSDSRADAAQALAGLIDEGVATQADTGDPIALPRRFANMSATQLADRLGQAFSAAIAGQPSGRWIGPLPSAYGHHLVFIEVAEPARAPEWSSVRDTVMRDWRVEQVRDAREARYAQLMERYRVIVEPKARTVSADSNETSTNAARDAVKDG